MERSLLYQVGDARDQVGDAEDQTGSAHVSGMGLEEWLSELSLAEELGLNSVWCFPVAGETGEFRGSAPEIWLAAIAARTDRLRLGWGVPGMLPPEKPPLRIAEQAAVLDLASSGRLDFALLPETGADKGVGSDEGLGEGSWDEGARMLVEMWDAPAFSWTSPRFNVMPIDVVPKPVQRPHPPIWYAGWSVLHAEHAGGGGMSYLDLSGGGDETVAAHLNAYRAARSTVDAMDLLSVSAFAVASEITPDALGAARLAVWEELGVDQAIMPIAHRQSRREESDRKIRFLAGAAGG